MKQELETDWADRQKEIAVNLEAPVHFANLLTPHFLKQKEVSSLRRSGTSKLMLFSQWSFCLFNAMDLAEGPAR